MLLVLLLALSKPYDWTTDSTVLGWIAVASLIIGILGIVIGVVIGYWFYRKGKNWHQVIYEVISDTPIVSVREQTGQGKIKVTYESLAGHQEEINDARLLTLKVWNAGNGDVIIWSPQDKDEAKLEVPIEFEFEGRTVVGLTHLETNPPNQVIQKDDSDAYLNSFSSTSTVLGLPRCIMKQDQSIQLGVLLNGLSGSIKIKEGKILNGEIINIHELRKRTSNRWNIVLTTLLSIFAVTVLTLFAFRLYAYMAMLIVTGNLLIIIGIVLQKTISLAKRIFIGISKGISFAKKLINELSSNLELLRKKEK